MPSLRIVALPICLLICLIGLLLVIPRESSALEGGVDVRNSQQTNQIQGLNFTTTARREIVYLRQSLPLVGSLNLNADARWTRDVAGSDFSPQNQETDRRSIFGGVRLGYHFKSTALGASADWLQQRETLPPSLTQDLNRSEYQLWFKTDPAVGATVRGNLSQRSSRREGSLNESFRNRERSGSLSSKYYSRIGELRYTFSVLAFDGLSNDSRQRQWANLFQYNATKRLADDRLSASARLRSNFFNQSFESGQSTESVFLLPPLSAGVRSDDTPDVQDPLEEELIPVPELFDRNRDAATSINIGDAASPTREFGGDYRNIQFDFGDSEELISATLYVDARLLHPELFQWRVFVSDDPEGFLWEELEAGQVRVEYEEWDTGHQGWVTSLFGGVSARYFKMVNVKLGITVPDLFVTELEVYTRETTEARKSTSDSQDHRFDGSLTYDATSRLRFQYDTTLRERRTVQDLRYSERGHGLVSHWRSGLYVLSGQVRLNRVQREGRDDTNSRNYQLAATRGAGTRLSTSLALTRSEDDLSGQDRATNTVSLGAFWKAAPRLHLRQRLSYGVRSEPGLDGSSRSITLFTALTSRPIPSLVFNIDRSDRWVSIEAGAGFQSFNETGIRIDWTPVPRISFSNNAKYYVRDRSDWSIRSLASWTPLSAGRIEFGVSGNNFRDTRKDATHQGVSAMARWRLRGRLVVDGSIGLQRLKTAGEVETPVGTSVHAAWTF